MLPSTPDVAPGGWRYARVAFLLAVPAVLLAPPVGAVCVLAGLASLWFHRDADPVALAADDRHAAVGGGDHAGRRG